MNEAILLIEDDATFSATLARALKRRSYQVLTAANPEAALAVVQAEAPGWIVLDLNLDGASGMALIPRLRERLPDCRIVVLTGYASITTAVDAIKLGAVQYLAKPADASASAMAAPIAAVPMSVDRMEWEHIQRILHEHKGNISATARALNMHRRTLQRKLLKRPARQ